MVINDDSRLDYSDAYPEDEHVRNLLKAMEGKIPPISIDDLLITGKTCIQISLEGENVVIRSVSLGGK